MEDIFEKIINKEIPAEIVYEDEHVVAFMDANPDTPGHTLVVPRKKSKNILDADPQTLAYMGAVIQKIAQGVLKAVGAQGFNLHANNNEVAGQIVPHMHWHIIPRYPDDGLTHWKGKEEYKETIPQVAEKVRHELNA
jgi:histidine triad (HIT) family protein